MDDVQKKRGGNKHNYVLQQRTNGLSTSKVTAETQRRQSHSETEPEVEAYSRLEVAVAKRSLDRAMEAGHVPW